MSSLLIRVRGNLLAVGLLSVMALGTTLLTGCGSSANTEGRTITGSGDVASGVTLSSSTSTTAILPSGTLTLTATVPADTNAAGVTWSIIGPGMLTNQTTTTAVYTAPASVTGTATPVIIATSIADPTKSGSATLAVQGTPVLEATELYPGHVTSPYAARIVVAGGQAPYVWTVDSGTTTLPGGLALSGTTDQAVISGTPTAPGTYNFTLKVVDNQTRSATVALTLVINDAVTCLVQNQVAFIYGGFRNGTPIARALSVTAAPDGTLTGLQDEGGETVPAGTMFTGKCVITNTNAGTFTLTGTGLSATYSHVVSDANDHGRIALTLPATEQGTGNFYVQDATAFSQTVLMGDWAFGVVGASTDLSHLGVAGRLTLDGSGLVSAATLDRNGKTPLGIAAAGQAVTGNMTAPDTNGRGTLTLTVAGSTETITYAYYVVNANKLLLVDVTASGKARVTGFMTRQTGTFDSSSLSTPAVLSLWGNSGSTEVTSAVALGRLSGATITDSTSGTLLLALDSTTQGAVQASQNYSGVAFTVAASGRATLSYTSGSVTRTFVGYLDAAANGYLVETTANANNNAGLLETQPGGGFTNTLPGQFLNGTQWPVSPGPISTLPSVVVSNGVLSATYGTGYFYVDPDTGRGAGTFSATVIGTDAMVLYELDPTRIRILRFGNTARDATIDWLNR